MTGDELTMRYDAPLLNGLDAYDKHHIRRAAEAGYFPAILHLGRDRRFRDEHPTLVS